MSVSGRAGLFTMDDGRFFGDLRGMPYTSDKRQKSGALRLEFGRVTITDATLTSAVVKTTVNTGITSVVSVDRPVSNVNATSGATSGMWGNLGTFSIGCTGAYVSAELGIYITATGQFSGQASGMNINYMVIGY